MCFLDCKNKININSINILIDAFISNKRKSLVLIFNNYDHILKNTNINTDKTTILFGDTILQYKILREFTNFHTIEGVNPRQFFNNKFHHEILIIENFINIYSINDSFKIELLLNDSNNNCIITKILEIDTLNNLFLDKKCISTIHYNEHHLIPLWVKYHKKLGFEKFIIYDNNFEECKKNELYKSIEDYKDDIFIINASWNYWLTSYGYNPVGQVIQQNHCIWKYSPKFVLLTDLDEYINIKNYNLFNNSISILSIPNWWFGCNNNVHYENNNFIYKLTKKTSIENRQETSYRKCLIQSECVDVFCVHMPILFNNSIVYLNYNEGYLNHYFIMSSKKRKCKCSKYCAVEERIIDIIN